LGRRRTIDSPRPAGRWAGRLRRSGSLARRVLFVRVGRRRHQPGTVIIERPAGTATWPNPDLPVGTAPAVGRTGRPGDEARRGGKLLARIAFRPRRPAPLGRLAATSQLGETAPFELPLLAAESHVPGVGLAESGLAESGLAGAGAGSAVGASAPRPIPLLPGEQTLVRRVRFLLVNACTVTSLGLGVCAILLSMHGGVRWAALCLVGCVSCDGLDGVLARRFGVASPFGAQLDSMADMCSFGIAAPVVVYAGMRGSAAPALVGSACALVAVCAAVRLARFNVSPKDGRFFCGVPTTTVAAVLGLAMLIGLRPSGVVAVAALAVLALAMISGFPYAKLGRVVKLPPWLWLAPAIGALLDYRVTFAALVALYLASGPLLWLRYRPR
jgi:CDP-diacylglycerol--serine O-phosphatidyltransferase